MTSQGRYEDVEGAAARIYTWLRYSAIRQLTWQVRPLVHLPAVLHRS